MKRLLSGVGMAAVLLVMAPVWAQTPPTAQTPTTAPIPNTSPGGQMPPAQSPTTSPNASMNQPQVNPQAGTRSGMSDTGRPMVSGNMTAGQGMTDRHATMGQRHHRVSAHRHYANYQAPGHYPRYRHRVQHWGWSPDDALTIELNRQELARVTSETAVPQYGSSAPPVTAPPPSAGYEEPPPGFPPPLWRF